jgi:hypothetical protein
MTYFSIYRSRGPGAESLKPEHRARKQDAGNRKRFLYGFQTVGATSTAFVDGSTIVNDSNSFGVAGYVSYHHFPGARKQFLAVLILKGLIEVSCESVVMLHMCFAALSP